MEDPQTFEQLQHIQQLLADVRADFQPVSPTGPEVELVFETPHPFKETFEHEEVIADRYATVARLAASCPASAPATCATVAVCTGPQADPAETPVTCTAIAGAAGEAESANTCEGPAAPCPETDSVTHDCAADSAEGPEPVVAVATVAAVAAEPSRRSAPAARPSARLEFGRLFAELRSGL